MTRRLLLAALSAAAALALPFLLPGPARAQTPDPLPPAPGLVLELADRGSGWAQYEWRDPASGGLYDLGPERPIHAPPVRVPGVPIPAVEGGDVPGMIARAAARYGLPYERMRRIAWCESKYQPGATSRGGHRGIFQFDGPTWRERAPLAGVSADFAVAYQAGPNVEVAAATMAAGQWGRWECR